MNQADYFGASPLSLYFKLDFKTFYYNFQIDTIETIEL